MRTDSFVYRSRIAASAGDVFDWHARPGAFLRLMPPWEGIRVIDGGNGLADGSQVELEVPVGPLRRRWTAQLCDVEPGRQFRDIQIQGPFARWDHTHTMTADGPDVCWLEDRIVFAPPWGAIGWWLGLPLMRRKLRATFAYRHRTTAADLDVHRAATRGGAMTILVTGSTGLVGRSLVPFLTTGGHAVTRLVRGVAPQEGTVRWDPVLWSIDLEGLENLDAVVHLAGENISSRRWSERQKRAIRESRTEGTRLLCESLLKLRNPPKTLVCASAIGFYGDRGDALLDETSPPGTGFLPNVCRDWEAATQPVRARGVRVINLRFGIVLSPAGGALAKMLLPFKLGMGGTIGSGRQYWSWVGIDDVIGAIHHALVCEQLSGPVNVVAPEPLTNREFTKVLGKVLNRPTILPVPAFGARIALGQMADELLLASARVVPRRLQETGYAFRFPTLEPALRHVLGR